MPRRQSVRVPVVSKTSIEPTRLTGQLLIAMPTLPDPRFAHSVSLICEHTEYGALGVVINRPLNMDVGEVLEQFDLQTEDAIVAGQPVFAGGPVQPERGFVIHDGSEDYDATIRINDNLSVTTSKDVLERLARGRGPGRVLFALGYAGWGAGQLEQELADNSWINVPVDESILFTVPPDLRWEQAARLLGIDVRLLGVEAGHA